MYLNIEKISEEDLKKNDKKKQIFIQLDSLMVCYFYY